MWFQLNTTFSTHLGALSTLQSNYGVTYSLSNFTKTTAPDMVEKDKSLTVVLTMVEGATFTSATMTDGTTSVTGTLASSNSTVTMTIAQVKGPVTVIARAASASVTPPEEEEPETPNNPSSGTPVPINWIKSAYYKCTDNDITKLTSGNDTSKKFWTTQVFTEDDLPVGSIITLTSEGFNIRKERWISATQGASSRLSAIDGPTTITIEAEDWESFDYLAFNLSKGSDMSSMTVEEINNICYIVRP